VFKNRLRLLQLSVKLLRRFNVCPCLSLRSAFRHRVDSIFSSIAPPPFR